MLIFTLNNSKLFAGLKSYIISIRTSSTEEILRTKMFCIFNIYLDKFTFIILLCKFKTRGATRLQIRTSDVA